MRFLSLETRRTMVKSFLSGSTYQQIASELDVAKSTVHEEVQRFITLANARGVDGAALEYGVTDEILALRGLAVELRRNDLTIPTVRKYLPTCGILERLGLEHSRIPSFARMMSKVTTPDVLRTYLDVAILVSDIQEESGIGPREMAQEYASTAAKVMESRKELARLQTAIRSLDVEYQSKKKRLEEEFYDSLREHEISMAAIDYSVKLTSELKKYGISPLEKAELVGRILRQIEALGGDAGRIISLVESYGSLEQAVAAMTGEEEQAKNRLKQLQNELMEVATQCTAELERKKTLERENEEWCFAIGLNQTEAKKLNEQISSAKEKLNGFMNEAETIAPQLSFTKAITRFLGSNTISDYEFKELYDRFVWIKDRKGFPFTSRDIPRLEDKSRKMLAELCLPLFRDEYVPKQVYDLEKEEHLLQLRQRDEQISKLWEELQTLALRIKGDHV